MPLLLRYIPDELIASSSGSIITALPLPDRADQKPWYTGTIVTYRLQEETMMGLTRKVNLNSYSDTDR